MVQKRMDDSFTRTQKEGNPFSRIQERIDRGAIISHGSKPEIHINRVGKVNWKEQNQKRAGIIPFTRKDSYFRFALGIDYESHTLTDFGGGVKFDDTNSLTAALREFNEETLNSFPSLKQKDLDNDIVIYNCDILIIFHYFQVDPENINKKFRENIIPGTKREIDDIVWLNLSSLNQTLKGISDSYGIFFETKNLILCFIPEGFQKNFSCDYNGYLSQNSSS